MKSLRSYLPLALVALLLVGAAMALRYGLIEGDGIGIWCSGEGAATPRCEARALVIQTFTFNRLGYLALVAAALAVLTRRRWLAWIGLATGIFGLELYCFDYGGLAAALALLVLARAQTAAPGEQQAEA
jgi:hypothetical protein